MMNEEKHPAEKTGTVRSVERALDVLMAFTAQESELSLAQISKKINLPKSTTFRLLLTLQNKRFVELDKFTGKYQLGSQLLSIYGIMLKSMDLRTKAYPYMKILCGECKETIHLYVRKGNQRVLLEQVEGSYSIKRYTVIGETLPLHCGASGKVLLAYLEEDELLSVLADPPQDEAGLKTEIDVDKIKRSLVQIRQDGYALSIGEREIGAASLAAPIFNHRGAVVAAVAISGVDYRFTPERVEQYIPLLRKTAFDVSCDLGYQYSGAPDSAL